MADLCSVDGCEKGRHTYGMCSAHYQKARYHGTLPPLPERDCAHCGARFTARKWGAVYCSRRCNGHARHARRKAAVPRRATSCAHCGADLASKRPDARFCSLKCGQDFRNAETAAALLASKATRPSCRCCDGPVPAEKSTKALYCSRQCRLRARRHEAYGLTRDELKALLTQHDVCAICGLADWGKKGPCVDHCHKTGAVRGILCGRCNTGLGQFGDDPKRLLSAVSYLERTGRTEG